MMKWILGVLVLTPLALSAFAQQSARPGFPQGAFQSTAPYSPTSSGGSATPFLIYENTSQNIGQPGDGGDVGRAPVIPPIDAPANSTIVLAITYNRAVTTLVGTNVTDTLGLTWGNPVCTVDAGSGSANAKTSLFVQNAGATGGMDTISLVVGTTNRAPLQYNVAVWGNLKASAVDGFKCTASVVPTSGGVIDPGSFTPTTTNTEHIIWNFTGWGSWTNVGANVPTGWTAGSGFTLHAASKSIVYDNAGTFTDSWAGEWKDDPSHSTNVAIDATLTATGESDTSGYVYHSVTVALAVDPAGTMTPASGIHLLRRENESYEWTTGGGTTLQIQMPFAGNLRVLTSGQYSNGFANPTVSDSCGTWTLLGSMSNSPMWYKSGCSADSTDVITITGTVNGYFNYGYQAWDIQNSSGATPQSVDFNGNCAAGTTSNAPTITPSTSSGLAIAQLADGVGPVTAIVSPTGAQFGFIKYTGSTDGGFDTAGNGIAWGYYSSNAVQHWNWSTPTVESCTAQAALFQ